MAVLPWVSIGGDASKPQPGVCNLFGAQSSIMVVGFLNDVLQEAGVWFGGIGRRPGRLNEHVWTDDWLSHGKARQGKLTSWEV